MVVSILPAEQISDRQGARHNALAWDDEHAQTAARPSVERMG